MILRLHVDRDLYAPEFPPPVLLEPFLGASQGTPGDPTNGRFAEYVAEGRKLFELTDPHSADIHVYPNVYDHVADRPGTRDRIAAFLDRAASAGKPAVFFSGSDSEEPLPVGDAWVFRTSIRRSRRSPREFAVPAWSEDFVERYLGGQLPPGPKRSKPVVGFCGYAAASGAPGHELRWHAMQLLKQSSLVGCNFLLRRAFWNGALTARDRARRQQQARREFVANIVGSDYVLCVRGTGNFSYRLYETLCCGRIPVFVDTDCVLPYEDAIDWRRLCVWVDERELAEIDRKVADYDAALTAEAFADRQRECRQVWREWLSPLGFNRNLHRHFTGMSHR